MESNCKGCGQEMKGVDTATESIADMADERRKTDINQAWAEAMVEESAIPAGNGGYVQTGAGEIDPRPQVGGEFADAMAMVNAIEELTPSYTAGTGIIAETEKGYFGSDGMQNSPMVMENVIESLYPNTTVPANDFAY